MTKKGVCCRTVKMGWENVHLMCIYNSTIDAQEKRGMRRRCICSHDTGHMWEASSPQPVLAGLMCL